MISAATRRGALLLSKPSALPVRFLSSSPPPFDLKKYGEVSGGTKITGPALETFKVWHSSLEKAMSGSPSSELAAAMSKHVHEKAEFHPPTYYQKWVGRDEMLLLLSAVSEVFGKSFVYERQWLSDDGKDWCLEFKATIGDTKNVINGVDLVKLNDQGQIVDFKVLARPPNAVASLKEEMMKKVPPRLAVLKAKQAMKALF